VFLGRSLGCSCQPRLDDHLFEVLHRDGFEAHQHGRETIEVWSREKDAWIVGEKRLLGDDVLDPSTQNRAVRRIVAEGAHVGGPKRTLPDESLVPNAPGGKATGRSFTCLWQREGDPTDVVPTSYRLTVARDACAPKDQ